ncbi:SIMPL domain-containing protein [bacterium]|nr:SIMPL domain-containing protein [bacterium]
MKKSIIASLLCAATFVVPFTTLPAGALNNEIEKGYISVSYTAEKEVSPDTVEISIAIKTDDKKSMSEAVRKNKEISDKVYQYLKVNIAPADGDYLKTSNYSARPSYTYESGKRIFQKYEVSNNIIVHTKSIDKISVLIDKSLALGATNVDSLNFSLAEKDEQCAELLSKATTQTRKRAAIVASAAGTSVIGIKNIDTSCTVNRYQNVSYARNTLMKSAMMDGAVPEAASGASLNIESGVITIYSNVNASFYVK